MSHQRPNDAGPRTTRSGLRYEKRGNQCAPAGLGITMAGKPQTRSSPSELWPAQLAHQPRWINSSETHRKIQSQSGANLCHASIGSPWSAIDL